MQDERIGIGAKLGDDESTLCVINPEMKCTSRESRSSLQTMTGPFSFRAALIAAASFGRRSYSSAPSPPVGIRCPHVVR